MTQIPNITAQQTEHDVGQQQKRLWAPEEWLKDTTQPAGPWILSKTERLTPTSNVAASTTSHLQPHDDKPNVAIQSSGHMFCDVTTPSPSLPPSLPLRDAGMQSAVAAPSEALTSGCHLELSPLLPLLHPRSADDWQDFWRILLFPMQPAAPPLHKQCLWLHSLSADFKQIFSLWNIIQYLQLLCAHWENNPALTIPLKLIGFSHREWEIRYRCWLKRPTYLFHFLSFYPASFKTTEPIPCSRCGPFHSSPPDGRFTTS